MIFDIIYKVILETSNMINKTPHIPVLFNEVMDSFIGMSDGYFVDCTMGYAGHSMGILDRFTNIKHIGIDRDTEALEFSKNKLIDFESRITFHHGTFSSVLPTLRDKNIVGVLADFGVSSLQLDKKSRGFSFTSETLDMRMDNSSELSAFEVVNEYSSEKLEYIFENYGEITQAKELAQAIINARIGSKITSAKELSDIIVKTLPKFGKIHPATLAFQSIRIEVNNELGEIEKLLDELEISHNNREIVSLITFHSLEDRLVKNRFQKWSKNCICDIRAMRCTCGNNHAIGKIITKKPITASQEELKVNPRSRSAKLRTFKFINKMEKK